MKIAISYLSSNNTEIETIKKINQTDADYLHVDLMDGQFVSKKNFEIEDLLKKLSKNKLPLDIHFMTYKPDLYFDYFLPFKPDFITFHYEAVEDIYRMINEVKRINAKVGIAIKPETKVTDLIPYLDKIDQVLVMSVNPGAGGQTFISNSLNRIQILNDLKKAYNYKFVINVDGGINDKTIKDIKKVKPDMIVSGSFVCKGEDYQERINKLR